jgi:hypothetical protein
MIYDCFTFFNELELLEMRLHELADVVDRFVLVEATRTHTNQPKPLFYHENRARFADFADKIIYVIVDDRAPIAWHGTRAVRIRDFSSAEEVFRGGYRTVPDAGWHFSCMVGVERIRDKLAACAHQEKNLPQYSDPEYIARTVSAGKPLFGTDGQFTFVSLDDSFPRWLYEHPERFSGLLKPVGTGEASAG